MRQILAIALALLSVLSSPGGWVLACPSVAADQAMTGKAKCVCCAQRPVCDCEPASDQAPQSGRIPASTTHKVPSCPCLVLASFELVAPTPADFVNGPMPAGDVASRNARQVPMFIRYCASLC